MTENMPITRRCTFSRTNTSIPAHNAHSIRVLIVHKLIAAWVVVLFTQRVLPGQANLVETNNQATDMGCDGDIFFWRDRGTNLMMQGSIREGRLRQDLIIDRNSRARLIAAGGGWVYWMDEGDDRIVRGKVINGALAQDRILTSPLRSATQLAADGPYVYCAAGSDLHQFYVDSRGQIHHSVIDSNSRIAVLAAGGGRIFWQDVNSPYFVEGEVTNGKLHQTRVLDNASRAIRACASDRLLFRVYP